MNAPHTAGAAATSRLRLDDVRVRHQNTLRAFASATLPNGLSISDISIHEKNGKRWASLPSKPVLDAEGRHAVDDAGKKKWVPVLRWRDRALADEFGRRVVALVEAEHPDVFERSP
jgi:hypothetical protein